MKRIALALAFIVLLVSPSIVAATTPTPTPTRIPITCKDFDNWQQKSWDVVRGSDYADDLKDFTNTPDDFALLSNRDLARFGAAMEAWGDDLADMKGVPASMKPYNAAMVDMITVTGHFMVSASTSGILLAAMVYGDSMTTTLDKVNAEEARIPSNCKKGGTA